MIRNSHLLLGAEIVLIPLLLTSSIFLQQVDKNLELIYAIGQLLSIVSLFAAILIILGANKSPIFTISLIAFIFLLRLGKGISPLDVIISDLYEALLLVLMYYTGKALWVRNPFLIGRQFSLFCILGLLLMVVQMLGVGEWTQVLRTDVHGGLISNELTQSPTLLVDERDLDIGATLQSRPAGVFASNNALSLVLSFAVALMLWQNTKRTRLFRSVLLALVCVLAMSKTVFAVIVCSVSFAVGFGDFSQRCRALSFLLFTSCWLFLYALLFPGLWFVNVSWDSWYLNFALRVISIEQSIGVKFVPSDMADIAQSLRPLLFNDFGDLNHAIGGFTDILSSKLLIISLGIFTLFWIGMFFLRNNIDRFCFLKNSSFHLIIVCILGVGLNAFRSPIFWIYLGFVLASLSSCNCLPKNRLDA
jgi:hypothetical protein